jgi:hypothetical protein
MVDLVVGTSPRGETQLPVVDRQQAASEHGRVSASGRGRPEESAVSSAPAPESYVWPLVALVLVILPQVLVPARMRLGPPSIVPIVEGAVVVVLLAVAAKPGPVPRAARPLVLSLFGVLILANTLAAVRLVTLVLRGRLDTGGPLTVSRLLVAAVIVISTNIVTFGLVYWQVDGGGPAGRSIHAAPYPDFQFPRPPPRDYRLQIGSHGSPTTCICRTRTSWRSAPPTLCRSPVARRD